MIHIFSDISALFPAILLDAYGVFWGGNDLLPGTKESMKNLMLQGKIVGILSNSTQLTENEIQKLHKKGLNQGEHFHFLLTSGEIVRSLFLQDRLPFNTPKKKFWLLGDIHPRYTSHQALFQNTLFQQTAHLHEADFIYPSIPHIKGEDQTDPQLFRHHLTDIKEFNLPMLCSNPDLFAHEGSHAVVRQGSLAAIYEEIGGCVHYIGKPYAIAYASAMQHFAQYSITQASQILMVGDTPETDIRGGRQYGMSTALVTQTGIMKDRVDQIGLNQAIDKLPIENRSHFYIEKLA